MENNSKDIINNNSNDGITVIKTDTGSQSGQNKCPKCGATDISPVASTGHLRCNFCHYDFEGEKFTAMMDNTWALYGKVIGSGAQDIASNSSDIVTFKCSSCGAEVVCDTASSMQARCHWCHHILSVNEQIPNGSVPDTLLPFKVSKEEAESIIKGFVNKRKFFANPKFKKEFTTKNVMGVFFPYMLLDVNSHAYFRGEGEHQTGTYQIEVGKRDSNGHAMKQTLYNADVYHVERDFDLTIQGLSIESNSNNLNEVSDKTNNVINAIMPFDTENCVKFNANYLRGFTSEKRNVNIDDLKSTAYEQSKDIARYSCNDTLDLYDRGVCWDTENLDIKGEQWTSAYLPVWLYSYLEVKGNKKLLHYVAVNARTKEVMGSVPIHIPMLLFVSFMVEIAGYIATIYVDSDYDWIFLTFGFIYFFVIYAIYRNTSARHTYEKETKHDMKNLKKIDNFLRSKNGQSSRIMQGANNNDIRGKFH